MLLVVGVHLMQINELRFLTEMIKDKDLGEDKLYLFEARLLPIAAKLGFKDLSSFVTEFMKPPSIYNKLLQQEIIEAMTTNESMFFRDSKPFQYLTDIIFPELKQRGAGNVNIWCAACSSGQEPYSIAMLIEENNYRENIKIIGSDIDSQILQKAQDGIYNQFEVQRGLSTPLLMKYFTQKGNNWQINNCIRERISFMQHNLLEDAGKVGRFDIVFCRYVLIYFDNETKLKVLNHIANVMDKGAYLILGGAETLPLGCEQFIHHVNERKIFVRK
jgi:chemotaxis protein methyltransferase CheR